MARGDLELRNEDRADLTDRTASIEDIQHRSEQLPAREVELDFRQDISILRDSPSRIDLPVQHRWI